MDTGVCFLTETKRSKAKWSLGDIRRADGKWRMLDNHDETLRAGEREKESDSEIESKRERERERGEGDERRKEEDTQRQHLARTAKFSPRSPRFSPDGDCRPGMVLLTLRDGVTACRRKHR